MKKTFVTLLLGISSLALAGTSAGVDFYNTKENDMRMTNLWDRELVVSLGTDMLMSKTTNPDFNASIIAGKNFTIKDLEMYTGFVGSFKYVPSLNQYGTTLGVLYKIKGFNVYARYRMNGVKLEDSSSNQSKNYISHNGDIYVGYQKAQTFKDVPGFSIIPKVGIMASIEPEYMIKENKINTKFSGLASLAFKADYQIKGFDIYLEPFANININPVTYVNDNQKLDYPSAYQYGARLGLGYIINDKYAINLAGEFNNDLKADIKLNVGIDF